MSLSKRNRMLMGLTLFSMFFGAGNLIFPPFLAYQAGNMTWQAMIGFCISAISLPVLGVIAVAKAGSLHQLAGRVTPWFAQIFVLLAYLSIGPGLAIPRNSVTSFEMAVLPFLPEGISFQLPQLIYSFLFFGIAAFVALKPEKLSDRLGKIMTPILLLLIAVIFVGCVFSPAAGYGKVSPVYQHHAAIRGFLDGYQTMDAIAALNFGIIFAMNIRAKGVQEEKQLIRETVGAGWIAGFLLLVVYCALAHIGGVAGGIVPDAANGARTLTGMVNYLFGPTGNILLAGVFVIACINTCIGLLSCCSNYFHELVPKISYKMWVVFFAVSSMIVANAGLNTILSVSVPILETIYPVCILLILLGLCHHFLKKYPLVYPVSIFITAVVSILAGMHKLNWCPSFLSSFVEALPLFQQGLPWLLPAVIGIALGILLSMGKKGADLRK